MRKCPVCENSINDNNTKCYSCNSEITYGSKGRIKAFKDGRVILSEAERRQKEARQAALPMRYCWICGNEIRFGQYYCTLCGEDDAYNNGVPWPAPKY
ncbi:hypothetical protein SAMN05192585_13243 [Acetanaerobacterium elongatum]|uniref:Double zinc ribbon n=1 Tax=Acetanaerobacterium elongatum TaxID=258515 RepID=A0A1H0EBY0_9FIRM|nr:hypothetical protein SAMN05192585_13243 [Acetanaerobacterium elongatum]